ncbi:MAG: HPP family protein [Desulfitobacteriaceae bacterium]
MPNDEIDQKAYGKTIGIPPWFSITKSYLVKMKGNRRSIPLVGPAPLDVLISSLGAFLGISIVAVLSMVYGMPLIVASFGATAVLVYGVPDAPLSQPRNVIFGHGLSAIAGVLSYSVFGLTWWSAALGTVLAIVLMMFSKTTHPPGGATALFAVLSQARPMYILTPVLTGAVILVVIGVIINNLSPNRSYPRYWL